jgi:hypothetical protein
MIVLFIDPIYTHSTKRGQGPEIRENARVNLNKNVLSIETVATTTKGHFSCCCANNKQILYLKTRTVYEQKNPRRIKGC